MFNQTSCYSLKAWLRFKFVQIMISRVGWGNNQVYVDIFGENISEFSKKQIKLEKDETCVLASAESVDSSLFNILPNAKTTNG